MVLRQPMLMRWTRELENLIDRSLQLSCQLVPVNAIRRLARHIIISLRTVGHRNQSSNGFRRFVERGPIASSRNDPTKSIGPLRTYSVIVFSPVNFPNFRHLQPRFGPRSRSMLDATFAVNSEQR